MSFPAEIQSSIRAQLADCLVGVLWQRLDYLSSRHLRVPRCELLLSSTSARGTIRAGTFSHLANVIQSGGEEGMWSFDRYGRWIEQRTDWVLTDTPTAAADPRGQTPSDEVMDLAELTELVDRLEKRSR
jgi:twitching motility protein PilT